MKISVVVASWNGLQLLQPCIAALRQQTVDHELVIVDNGSRDGTVAWIEEAVPTANCLALPANRGFAGGYNAGIRAAGGDLIILLNNDTVAAPDALAQLTTPFASDERLGATSGVLVFAHRPTLIASAGIEVASDGVHRDVLATAPLTELPAEPVPIFGASGGAVCYRRRALDDVGLFAEPFFAYLEDADLAWRLRLRGWNTLLTPAVRIAHVYSATGVQGSPFKQRLLARNRWWLLLRCWPRSLLLRCLPSILRYDLLAIIWAAAHRQSGMITGRLQAWSAWSRLSREHRTIQRQRLASLNELSSWLQPAPSIRATLAATQALEEVLKQR
ncbi:MAG: glycosyltransferase family 2 protein [Herpetosiphonaceae bacterium]|nr:glycosyltransferase family 2 protein [Herpetosiphonaceae bacterium]